MFKKLIILLSLLFLLPSSSWAVGELDFRAFGDLVIQEGGRRKPVSTFASEAVRKISGRTTVEGFGKKWQAEDFILSLMLEDKDWPNQPLILCNHKDLLKEMNLPLDEKRFSFTTLTANEALKRIAGEAAVLRQKNKADDLTRLQKEAESVMGRLGLFQNVGSGAAFTIFPATEKGAAWQAPTPGSGHPALPVLSEMLTAYTGRDAFNFSKKANELHIALRDSAPQVYPSDAVIKLETLYNTYQPFDIAAAGYALGFILLLAAKRLPALFWPAMIVCISGWLVHVWGLVARCIIAGRPPVTNMYESVVWASFGVVLCGFIFQLVYRGRIYLLSALPAGFLCLLVLSLIPSAMPGEINPLVPVLRDNFWLVIHVLTITSSYAVFMLAWALGHVVLWGYVKNPVEMQANRELHQWLYRVIQLGVLLLAAGTILGGVWANYSWGRFWGWDPKETWALIALLCYIFVLHGRMAGMWSHFGMAVASVICFCAVLMTWYGVNFVLGKGLHSYGFGLGGEGYVVTFVALDLALVGLAAWRHLSASKKVAA